MTLAADLAIEIPRPWPNSSNAASMQASFSISHRREGPRRDPRPSDRVVENRRRHGGGSPRRTGERHARASVGVSAHDQPRERRLASALPRSQQSLAEVLKALFSVGTALHLVGRGMHRLGRCTLDECTNIYADTSRNGNQRYCSPRARTATRCGVIVHASELHLLRRGTHYLEIRATLVLELKATAAASRADPIPRVDQVLDRVVSQILQRS